MKHEESVDPKLKREQFVVHCRTHPYHVYIGRPGPWGNPFIIGKDGNRIEVIEKYRQWLMAPDRLELRNAARKYLANKVLGCYCAPLACHGHILVTVANSPPEIRDRETSLHL